MLTPERSPATIADVIIESKTLTLHIHITHSKIIDIITGLNIISVIFMILVLCELSLEQFLFGFPPELFVDIQKLPQVAYRYRTSVLQN